VERVVIDNLKAAVLKASLHDPVLAKPTGASLDTTASDDEGSTYSLRWVLVHMIEETARHCGYLDLLGEATDDAVGM